MAAAEYVSAFASIILALAVTDLATSMHRLLRARARVGWSWLPLAAALLILLATVQFWWTFFDLWRAAGRFTLGGFLPDFLTLLLLFFIASAALPDEVPASGLDLTDYYFDNRVYFWTLFALLAISTTVSTLLHRAATTPAPPPLLRWVLESGNLPVAAIAGVLAATGRRWVHRLLVLFLFTAMVWQWVALSIAG